MSSEVLRQLSFCSQRGGADLDDIADLPSGTRFRADNLSAPVDYRR
jgi:hypothetical protein